MKKWLNAKKVYYWKKVISIEHEIANALNKLMTEFYIEDSDYVKTTLKEVEYVMTNKQKLSLMSKVSSSLYDCLQWNTK